MKTDMFVCKLAGGEYELCNGPKLMLDDNSRTTFYCEHHARMVAAWSIETVGIAGPIWQYLNKLDEDGLKLFHKKMESVSLDVFIPYVPRTSKRTEPQ